MKLGKYIPWYRVHQFPTNIEPTSKFLMPEGWHEAGSILGTHSFEVICEPHHYLIAYKLIHSVACKDTNCNNYAESIKHHHSKFSCPGNQMPSFVNACLGTCGNDWVTEDTESAFASPADTHKHNDPCPWQLQPSRHEELIRFISSVSFQVLTVWCMTLNTLPFRRYHRKKSSTVPTGDWNRENSFWDNAMSNDILASVQGLAGHVTCHSSLLQITVRTQSFNLFTDFWQAFR